METRGEGARTLSEILHPLWSLSMGRLHQAQLRLVLGWPGWIFEISVHEITWTEFRWVENSSITKSWCSRYVEACWKGSAMLEDLGVEPAVRFYKCQKEVMCRWRSLLSIKVLRGLMGKSCSWLEAKATSVVQRQECNCGSFRCLAMLHRCVWVTFYSVKQFELLHTVWCAVRHWALRKLNADCEMYHVGQATKPRVTIDAGSGCRSKRTKERQREAKRCFLGWCWRQSSAWQYKPFSFSL